MIDKLAEIAKKMVDLGGKAPTFNLCNVSVKGTNLFCAESKGIPRVKMPQLTDEQTADFQKHLSSLGLGVTKTQENASFLRATQDELNGAKVASAAKKIESDKDYAERRVIISKDNYILDGHHFWAGKLANDLKDNVLGNDTKMNVARIDIGIFDLLEAAEKFTGGKGKKGVEESTIKKDHAMGNIIDRQFLIDNHKCPECDGTGEDENGDDCPYCDGDGYIEDSKKDTDDKDTLRTEMSIRTNMIDSAFLVDGVRRTKDGYLVADARIARTGIQEYRGSELGMPHLDTVRVYRPPNEVFSKAAMKSLAHRPITLNHPGVMVDASNWRDYAIGHTGDEVTKDGEFVRVPMVIMDSKAIDAYEKRGVKELSVGYSTDLKWGRGETPDGEIYDAKQTAIRGNHLAVVPAARGGSRLRIGDDDQKGDSQMVKAMIDGLPQPLEFADERAAAQVQTHVSTLLKQLADASKKASNLEAEEEKKKKLETDAATMKGEIVALKTQLDAANAKLTDAEVDKMIEDRLDLRMKAHAAMDGKVDFTGKSPAEIRRTVVMAKLGDAAKNLTDAEVVGAFKYAIADVKPQTGTDRLADNLSMLQFGGTHEQNNPRAIKDAAYNQHVQDVTNAWKTTATTR